VSKHLVGVWAANLLILLLRTLYPQRNLRAIVCVPVLIWRIAHTFRCTRASTCSHVCSPFASPSLLHSLSISLKNTHIHTQAHGRFTCSKPANTPRCMQAVHNHLTHPSAATTGSCMGMSEIGQSIASSSALFARVRSRSFFSSSIPLFR